MQSSTRPQRILTTPSTHSRPPPADHTPPRKLFGISPVGSEAEIPRSPLPTRHSPSLSSGRHQTIQVQSIDSEDDSSGDEFHLDRGPVKAGWALLHSERWKFSLSSSLLSGSDWKRRYFVLKGSILYYFKSPKNISVRHAVGKVHLGDVLFLTRDFSSCAHDDDDDNRPRPSHWPHKLSLAATTAITTTTTPITKKGRVRSSTSVDMKLRKEFIDRTDHVVLLHKRTSLRLVFEDECYEWLSALSLARPRGEQHLLMHGHMYQRSRTLGLWVKRYYTLQGNHLCAFQDQTSFREWQQWRDSPQLDDGSIRTALSLLLTVLPVSGCHVSAIEEPPSTFSPERSLIELCTPSHTYKLMVASAQERVQWMAHLLDVINGNKHFLHPHARRQITSPLLRQASDPPSVPSSTPTLSGLLRSMIPSLSLSSSTPSSCPSSHMMSSLDIAPSTPAASLLNHMRRAPDTPERAKLFDEILSNKRIHLSQLKSNAFYGITECGGMSVRSVVWKLLLGYLPMDRSQWSASLAKSRHIYSTFAQELVYSRPPTNQHIGIASGNLDLDDDVCEGQLLRQLVKDMPRTQAHEPFFAEHVDLNSQHLEYLKHHPSNPLLAKQTQTHRDVCMRILYVFAKLHPGVSYVQGMNELLAILYHVTASDSSPEWSAHAEADTFFCFSNLMSEVGDRFIQSLDQTSTGILACVKQFGEVFKVVDFELWHHLEDISLKPHYFALRWLSLLLCQVLEMDDVVRLWDSLFADQQRFAFLDFCCIALLVRVRDKLLGGNFASCLQLLQDYPKVNLDSLFCLAMQLKYRHQTILD